MFFLHFLNIKNLAKFNPKNLRKFNGIYTPNKISISLCKNDEIFPGKKTVKQLTVFMKEPAVLCTVFVFFFKKFKDSCSNQVFFFFLSELRFWIWRTTLITCQGYVPVSNNRTARAWSLDCHKCPFCCLSMRQHQGASMEKLDTETLNPKIVNPTPSPLMVHSHLMLWKSRWHRRWHPMLNGQ